MKELLTVGPKVVTFCRPLTIDELISPPAPKQSLTEVVCDEFGFDSHNYLDSSTSWRDPKLAT
jgi:hypothetical protein